MNFKEEEFIILREINISNQNTSYYLVIHLKSFYIFMMKKLHYPIYESEKSHEIYFNKNYSHRCMTRFYGFVEKHHEITGFIYEFLCNGSLDSYLTSNNETSNEIFSMITIARLFQGIEYLHSNHLIHRDLKPSNILLDNNYLPYITDFETIRHTKDFKCEENQSFSYNFGSILYSSPEQDKGEFISYPTDIYSFGLIIYFLFEKKDMLSFNLKKNSNILQMHNASRNISNLYEQCVLQDQEKRPTIQKIRDILIKEFNQFECCFENFLFNEQNKIDKYDIIKFIYETRSIQNELEEEIDMYFKNIFLFQLFYAVKEKEGISSAYVFYGDILRKKKLYYNESGIKKNYLKAKQYYEKAEQLNDSEGIYKLGILYCCGLGVKQDFIIAKKYFEIAAKKNNSDGLNCMGSLYSNGKGVEKDYLISKQYVELSAKQNNPDALINLGIIYLNGFGTKQDFKKAAKYFEISAELKCKSSFYYLGNAYFNGYGVTQNYEKAKKYLEQNLKEMNPINFRNLKSIYLNEYFKEQDLILFFKDQIKNSYYGKKSDSYLLLGIIYYNGYGVKKNYLKAKEYYEKAVKKKNSSALINLYSRGQGVEKDYFKAKKYYELAAQQNDSLAISNLGVLYENGFGVEQDYLKALEYYELSAKQNDSEAFFHLGYLYEKGHGVKQDFLIAKKYYKQSAHQNNLNALILLGNLYFSGKGTKQNYSKARECYELSINQDDAPSLRRLAYLYENGLGTKQDYSVAKKYYELLANQNCSYAFLKLGFYYAKGLGTKQDYSMAKYYLELSAQQNETIAFFYLGDLYALGLGVKQNYLKAKEYYELSAKQNDSDALRNLGFFYENGLGVKQNYLKAKKYYELSAK